jgi:hypothetical protein
LLTGVLTVFSNTFPFSDFFVEIGGNMANETPVRKITLWDYTKKSIKWTVGNAIFALFAIIVLVIANAMSTNNYFGQKIDELVKDGAIMFVCCAIVGAVLIEFWVAGFTFNANEITLIFVIPILVHALLALEYMLILLGVAAKDSFIMTSWTSKIVIGFSVIYCILGKANYYIREDERHEQQRVQHSN